MSYPHGNYLRYFTAPRCCCDDCSTAALKYRAAAEVRRRRGQIWADLDEVQAHLQPLFDLGLTDTAIAESVGLSARSVRTVKNRDRGLRYTTGQRLMSASFAKIPDIALMSSEPYWQAVEVLVRKRGRTYQGVAQEAHGWARMAKPRDRVQVGTYRQVLAVLARCDECGSESMDLGRWCRDCFARAHYRVRPAVGCGTPSGYQRHRRRGERPCAECRHAHTQDKRWAS
jgi:hypothetical protein